MSLARLALLVTVGLTACIRMIALVDEDAAVGDGDGDSDVDGDGDVVGACGVCGDGLVRCDEQCDDGAREDGDGCDSGCRFEPVGGSCGDGALDEGEVCDDGDVVNGDACNPTCNFANTTSLFVGAPGVQGGQDGSGRNATLGGWGALAILDDALWYGDGFNHVLRHIDLESATVTTIAGDGAQQVADDAFGHRASFFSLEALATDGNTVWVADLQRIRAVDTTPPYAVTTVAGDGTQGCADGIGPAAQFQDIRGLTYAHGFVWFLDSVCATVRRFDPETTEVVTVAGSPCQVDPTTNNMILVDGVGLSACFGSPRYMATNMTDILYIADTNGAAIRTYDITTQMVSTFAGTGIQAYLDGIGTAASIHRPRGLAVDGTSLYFTEFNQHTIRQGILATQEVSTMIGTQGAAGYQEGTGNGAMLNGPFSIVYHFPSASLFVLDSGNYVIRRIR